MNEPKRTLTVLRFRSIGAPTLDDWLTSDRVPPKRLEEMLSWLFKMRWQGITAQQLVHGLELSSLLPERPLMVTFDGVCRTVLEVAVPILRRFRVPAIGFVATDLVGRTVELEPGSGQTTTLCTWEELQQLSGSDVSIQSMGVSYRRFSSLEPAEQEREAAASKEAIEARLGRPVQLFAYPRGSPGHDADDAIQVLRRAGYRAAFSLGGAANPLPATNPFRLARIPMGFETDLEREIGG